MDLLERAARHPDAPGLDDLTRQRSAGELVDRAWRIASLLRDEFELEPGAHAAMLVGNRVEFVELMVGALFSGIDMVGLNWHLTPTEMRYIVDDAHARVLFVDPALEEAAGAIGAPLPAVRVGTELDAALDEASSAPRPLDGRAGGPMLYTSGTTGRPKGVLRGTPVTIAEAVQLLAEAGRSLQLTENGPHLVTGPMYHGSPYGFASMCMGIGAPIVIMPRFDAAQTLRLIVERDVATTHLVPVMMTRLLTLPEDTRTSFDPSSLDCVLHGAAPVSIPVKKRMIEWWGPVLVEYWGSSEGGAFCMCPSEDWLAHPGTVGRPVESYEVFAVDASGRRLGPGEVGLLYCRHTLEERPFHYWNDEAKTDEAYLDPSTFTNRDMGHVDEEGYVYLSDRAADMIISGGVNIYPAEVEAALIEHPRIADVAVFGIPDDEWGESVKAAVQLGPGPAGGPQLETEILDWAREHLASYKLPRSIDFHEELPRSTAGKLYKRTLREPYWKDRERRI